MFFKKLLSLVFIFSLFSFNVFAYGDSIFVWNNNLETLETNSNISAKLDSNNLQLESESGILIEQHSGQILFEHNSHEKLRPASVTKVMSILLIMEAIDSGTLSYTDKIPCTEAAAAMGGSQIWLDVREELTVDEMLKAICVVSANDCTVAMAEYLCGSQEAFVEKMNTKAQELGMKDTSFKNCHGLDEDGHLTSAYDIALMSRELLNKHPSITKYTTIWMDSLRDGKSQLVNTNKLIRNYKGITGLKTGSTSLALYNLSASATREGLSLIAVIMKGPTSAIRFSDAQKLLDYGFSNYSYKSFANQNEVIKSVTVTKGVNQEVNAIYETSPAFLIKKGDESNINYEVSLANTVQAPVYEGQLLGTVKYFLNDTELGIVNLVAESSVNEVGLLNMNKHIFTNWFSLLRL
ncbi:MAG: D-alanyl-D-alanine carboxypeptidase family protein [Clostridia bacterium]